MRRAVTGNPDRGRPVDGHDELRVTKFGRRQDGKDGDVGGQVNDRARPTRRTGERIDRPVSLEQIDSVPGPNEVDRMVVAERDGGGNESTRQPSGEIRADQPGARYRLAATDRAGQPSSGQLRRIGPRTARA